MMSLRRGAPICHFFLFPLASFWFSLLSIHSDNEWLIWLRSLGNRTEYIDTWPRSFCILPLGSTCFLVDSVSHMGKLCCGNSSVYNSNSNSIHVEHIFLMVGGQKPKINAIVILFCLMPYGFVSQFTRNTGYNYWLSSWTKGGPINRWTFLF